MRRLVRTKKYEKSLKRIPTKDREAIEAEVGKLEGDWSGLNFRPLEGFGEFWRLRVGNYRVLCRVFNQGEVEDAKRGKQKTIQIVSAEEARRRTSTTY